MTKAEREKWLREAKRALTAEQDTVLNGGVPAKLKAETAQFDITRLGARPPDTASQAQMAWDIQKAKYEADNDTKMVYRNECLAEIKYAVARRLEAAHERSARLTWTRMIKLPECQI